MTALFADTNIIVYAYTSDPTKSKVAELIVRGAPVIANCWNALPADCWRM